MLKGIFKKKTPGEKYLAHLDRIFQTEPEYFIEKSEKDGIAGVTTMVYKDISEKGMITGITYGLSLGNHQDWKFGRPELIISVDSEDISFAKVAGFLANKLRGNCPFSYSNTINFSAFLPATNHMRKPLCLKQSFSRANSSYRKNYLTK